MSDSSRTGVRSRKSWTVLAAALIVAMMLAVPAMASFDSDAELNETEAGFSIKMVNPTESEISDFSYESKASDVLRSAGLITDIFRDNNYSDPTVTADSYTKKWAEGLKLRSDYLESTYTQYTEAGGVTITYTATSAGDLVKNYVSDDYEDAAAAIKAYFGNEVAIGDVLKFTGKTMTEISYKSKGEFAKVSDGVRVYKSTSETEYIICDIDLTVSFTHGGQTKTIEGKANFKYMLERSLECNYHGTAYSDLTGSSPCTIEYGPDKYSLMKGDITFKVDGKDYSFDHRMTPRSNYDTTANLLTDEMLNSSLTGMKAQAAAIPAGTDNVTVGREYSDAEAMYDDVMLEVAGKDILKIVLIVIGVILAIILVIVLIVIILLVRRSKKRRQAV